MQINFLQTSLLDPFDYLLDRLQINHIYLKDFNLNELKDKILRINLSDELNIELLKNKIPTNETYKNLFFKFLKKNQLNLALLNETKHLNKEILALLNLFFILFHAQNHLIILHNDYGYFSLKHQTFFTKILKHLKETNNIIYLTKFHENHQLFDLKVYEKH